MFTRALMVSFVLIFISAIIILFNQIPHPQAQDLKCVPYISQGISACTIIRGFNQNGLRAFLEQFLFRDIPRINLNNKISFDEPIEGFGFSIETGPATEIFDQDLQRSGIIAYRFDHARSIFRGLMGQRQDVAFDADDSCDLYYLIESRKFIIIFDTASGLEQINNCSATVYYKMQSKK